jgi:polyphosphate kinase
LIVRGISCIVPGIEGKTDNIHITSIVGRYLEHSRVYIFGKGTSEKMYISSADFMTRNTERRVEVACPILDTVAKEKIHQYLELALKDNTKARSMSETGRYRKKQIGDVPFNSQLAMMRLTPEGKNDAPQKHVRRTAVASK